jgi:GT2 family glycosyltransferase
MLPLESSTIKSLINIKEQICEESEIVVWDNSPEKLPDNLHQEFAKAMSGFHYSYIADGKNTSLSVIYNKIIGECNSDEYLILFDHDTTFGFDYFDKLKNAVLQNPQICLFLPLVKFGGMLVSPSHGSLFSGKYWKTEKTGILKTKGTTAINSGMAIATNYLKTRFKGYNEKLKFYDTDLDFLYKFSKDNDNLFVLDVKINHILNFYEEETPIVEKINRYRQQRQGRLIRMKEKNFVVYLLFCAFSLLFSVKLAIKHSDIRFLF